MENCPASLPSENKCHSPFWMLRWKLENMSHIFAGMDAAEPAKKRQKPTAPAVKGEMRGQGENRAEGKNEGDNDGEDDSADETRSGATTRAASRLEAKR